MWLGCTCRNWRDDEEEGSLDRCWGRNWLNKLWNVWGKRWNGRFVQPLRNQNRRRAETTSRVSTQRNVTKPERVLFFFFFLSFVFREGSSVQHRRKNVSKSRSRFVEMKLLFERVTRRWQLLSDRVLLLFQVCIYLCVFTSKPSWIWGYFDTFVCRDGKKETKKKNRAATKCQPSVSV